MTNEQIKDNAARYAEAIGTPVESVEDADRARKYLAWVAEQCEEWGSN